MSIKKPKIKIVKNGPYLVSGGIPLIKMVVDVDADGVPSAWREVERYPVKEVYTLCRCGASKNKPFCDGSHGKVNFDGTETAAKKVDAADVTLYDGPELDLLDAKPLCTGAGFCTRAGNIWNLVTNSDNPDYKKTAIQEAADCPSGRLVLKDKNGKIIEPSFEPSIVVVVDQDGVEGPLWVRGGVDIESSDGTLYENRNRVALCRCGRSEKKPFCDGYHLAEA
jgi:CDGSH-type Zn-finger protein